MPDSSNVEVPSVEVDEAHQPELSVHDAHMAAGERHGFLSGVFNKLFHKDEPSVHSGQSQVPHVEVEKPAQEPAAQVATPRATAEAARERQNSDRQVEEAEKKPKGLKEILANLLLKIFKFFNRNRIAKIEERLALDQGPETAIENVFGPGERMREQLKAALQSATVGEAQK